jgi:hypothetical protein
VVLQDAVAQLLAELLAGALELLLRLRDDDGVMPRCRWKQDVEEPLLGVRPGQGAMARARSAFTISTAMSARSRTIDSTSRPT